MANRSEKLSPPKRIDFKENPLNMPSLDEEFNMTDEDMKTVNHRIVRQFSTDLQKMKLKEPIKVFAYCPEKFQKIQQLDNIDTTDIISSLKINRNRDQVFKAGQGSGKSGSLFFYSENKKYVIKSLRGSEKRIFLSLIDDYIQHLYNTSQQRSLLARIYGIFTIKSKLLGKIDIMIMQNTGLYIDDRGKQTRCLEFDLKGSLYKRSTRFNPIQLQLNFRFTKQLKDRNFLDIQNFYRNEKDIINLPKNEMREINRILETDANFLKKHNLIDYSVLLKIEKLGGPNQQVNFAQSRNIYISEDGTEAYHIGVIDYLQNYTAKKWVEHNARTRFGAHPMSALISCTSAPKYKERFANFMRNKVFMSKNDDDRCSTIFQQNQPFLKHSKERQFWEITDSNRSRRNQLNDD